MVRFDTATGKIDGIIRDFEKKAEALKRCAEKLKNYQASNKQEMDRLDMENKVYQVSIDRAGKVYERLLKLVS